MTAITAIRDPDRRARLPTFALAVLAFAGASHLTAHASESPMPRILVIATSHTQLGNTGKPTGAYAPEIAHPHQVFTAAGYQLDLATPKGGATPVDGRENPDPATQRFLLDPANTAWLANARSVAAVKSADYIAVFVAGGHGTMWDLPDDRDVQRVIAEIDARGGVVGAVCHGPAALVNVLRADHQPLVAGKRVAAFTDDEERAVGNAEVVPFLLASTLVARGAIHVPAPNWAENVVVDGTLVTGQNPASAKGVAERMVEVLSARR